MKRINKKLFLITTVAVLLPLLAGLVMWNHLPETMTTHWGADGKPDGTASRAFAVFATPLFLLLMHFVCVFSTLFDDDNKKQSSKVLAIAYWAMPLVSLYAGIMIYGAAFNLHIDAMQVMTLLMGVLFIIIGNYLPKCTPNSTIGIRIPWTLQDTENWRHTHRFGGKCFLACGLALFPCALLPSRMQLSAVLILLLITIASCTAYSYHLHKKKRP